MKRCHHTAGYCSEQVSYNTSKPGSTVCSDQPQTGLCPYKGEAVGLTAEGHTPHIEQLRNLLAKSGVKTRSWRIGEYVAKDGSVVYFEGYVLVHGSEDAGPYTEYLFDLNGDFLPGGVTTWYDDGKGGLENA